MRLIDEERVVQFIGAFVQFHTQEGWTTPWIDDQMWMIDELCYAIPLIQRFNEALAVTVTSRVRALGVGVLSNWDTTCCGPRPGGVWWDYRHTYKATASNAGAVNALLALNRLTGETQYLTIAKTVFNYWRAEQVQPSGQVYDGINLNGTKDIRIFTYNEGMFVLAASQLAEIESNTTYLQYARQSVQFLIRNETDPVRGVLREQPDHVIDNSNFDWQEFKGITFRYVMQYALQSGDQEAIEMLRKSIHSLWSHTGAFPPGFPWASWTEDPTLRITLASQTAGLVSMLAWTDAICNGHVSDNNGGDGTEAPTGSSTLAPTGSPTLAPTGSPTLAPTTRRPIAHTKTQAPTETPTTESPTLAPTGSPTTGSPTAGSPATTSALTTGSPPTTTMNPPTTTTTTTTSRSETTSPNVIVAPKSFEKQILFYALVVTIGVAAIGGVSFVIFRIVQSRRRHSVREEQAHLQQSAVDDDEENPFQDAFSDLEDDAINDL